MELSPLKSNDCARPVSYLQAFHGSESPELIKSAVMKGFTLADYLAREQQDGQRYEYYRGELFAMRGGTPAHSLIASNFIREAGNLLKGKPCVVYNSDLRIKCDSAGLYTYPDASIVCGELELDAEITNTVLNPTVIVEVLSDLTEKYDRGRKSMMFRGIKSLKELVLISKTAQAWRASCDSQATVGDSLSSRTFAELSPGIAWLQHSAFRTLSQRSFSERDESSSAALAQSRLARRNSATIEKTISDPQNTCRPEKAERMNRSLLKLRPTMPAQGNSPNFQS